MIVLKAPTMAQGRFSQPACFVASLLAKLVLHTETILQRSERLWIEGNPTPSAAPLNRSPDLNQTSGSWPFYEHTNQPRCGNQQNATWH